MADKAKLFSLRLHGRREDYATLAETISAYKRRDMEADVDPGVKSIRFKGWVLADGKELLELLEV